MTDNVVKRQVQRRDDPFGIPACFYWTVDEVADWVDSIGYSKYKENFRSHFINGRKLLTVDACVLPRMGITHFGDILGLCKHIREVLGIKRHLRGYNPWQLRTRYISMAPNSGKKHPQITYRQHAVDMEGKIEARLEYFRKRNYYYTGWSMEPDWDKQIKEEEKAMREELRKAGTPVEDKSKKLIGQSMQERLRAAADRLLSDHEPPQLKPEPGKSFRVSMERVRKPRLRLPSSVNKMGTTVLGHVNWSPVRLLPYLKEGDEGGEWSSVEVRGNKVRTITEVANDKVKVGNKEERRTGKVNMLKGVNKEKNKSGKQEKESVKKDDQISKEEKPQVVKNGKKNGDRPYHVAAVFHWKKMETSTGYPPLRLDLKKCGYYYGPEE